MGLKVIITNHSTSFNCSAGMNSRWHPEISEKQPCYLPYGKTLQGGQADGTASPALSRACGKLLQLTLDALDLQHPRRRRASLAFCSVRV